MQTKRTLVCAAAMAILAVPATALAATKTYVGSADDDPETSVKLRLESEAGDRFFKSFVVRDLAVTCDDGAIEGRVRSARLDGRAVVGDRGRFETRGEDGDQVLKLEGRARARRASGTLRLTGRIEVEGQARDCRTGPVAWTAET
jgi:hypothetical protein